MYSCEKIIEVVYQYLDHDIQETEIVQIQKHLELCRSCFGRVEFERILRIRMQTVTHKTCPDKLKKRIQDLIDQF